MGEAKREKSKKYAGVYWRQVARLDGQGEERMYYIRYRRGGRGAKEIEEPIGRASEGMTEAKANLVRGKRIQGGELANTEKRKQLANSKLTGGVLTVGRLWEIYRQAHEANASIKTDTYNYINHIEKRLANRTIPDIETEDIEAIRKAIENKGLAAQTVKHVLGQIRRIIRYGLKLGICAMPEKLIFEMPKVDNVKTENMSAEQLAAYWQALDGEADQDAAAFLKLALVTGMRKGALMALRWNDVDFERGFITLRGEAAKKGKTEEIPLNEAARGILKAITKKSDYVFPGKNGGQRKDYRRIARRVRAKAGLPEDFRPLHGLRHTFASALASSGKVDIYTLQKLLTHESTAMTQRYAHLADEAIKRAANVANILAPNRNDEDE